MKFKTGDIIRVIENNLLGEIMGISFNSIYQQEEYIVEWKHSPGKHETYPVDECDPIWALEPCPVVHQYFAPKATIKIGGVAIGTFQGVSAKIPTCNGYDHTWVDVGFHHSKFVCKYCDEVKRDH